jgi:hypothetical protein
MAMHDLGLLVGSKVTANLVHGTCLRLGPY